MSGSPGRPRTSRRRLEPHVVGKRSPPASSSPPPSGQPLSAVIVGSDLEALAQRSSQARSSTRSIRVEHALLTHYTADGYASALEQLIKKLEPRLRRLPAHLPGARLRAAPRHPLRPGAHQRRRRPSHGRRTCLRAPALPGQAQRATIATPAPAPASPPCRPAHSAPNRSKPAPPTVETFTPQHRRRAHPHQARRALPRSRADGRSRLRAHHRLRRPRHQGAGQPPHRAKNSPPRSAPNSPPRVPSATTAGCPWSARSAAPARPSRPSSTSPSESPAPSSTWSA